MVRGVETVIFLRIADIVHGLDGAAIIDEIDTLALVHVLGRVEAVERAVRAADLVGGKIQINILPVLAVCGAAGVFRLRRRGG